MTEITSLVLRRSEAVELAAALAGILASNLGLRFLVIKGAAATAAGVRPARLSADVDLLMHPDDTDLMIEQLSSRGWRSRPFEEGMGIPKHSITMYHADWPCDIDVHFRFPGLESAAYVTFNALAAESGTHSFAGIQLDVPSATGMIIVQATHALRNLHLQSHHTSNAAADYAHLIEQVELPSWDEISLLLDKTAAWAAAERFLIEAYPDESSKIQFPEPSEDWILRTTIRSAGELKLIHLSKARWIHKPGILLRSLFPGRDVLATSDLAFLEAKLWIIILQYPVRWFKFLRQMNARKF